MVLTQVELGQVRRGAGEGANDLTDKNAEGERKKQKAESEREVPTLRERSVRT